MKRDMDLIRLLLIALESEKDEQPDFNQFGKQNVYYHMALIIEAGLARGKTFYADINPEYPNTATLWSLTWAGHEFLDAARDQSRWEEARSIVNSLGGASFQLWLSVLTDLVKQNLGIQTS